MIQLIEYFAERMISAEILQKNAVMQMVDDKVYIGILPLMLETSFRCLKKIHDLFCRGGNLYSFTGWLD